MRCPWCGYLLDGIDGDTCPECGKNRFADLAYIKHTRRSIRADTASAILSVGIVLVFGNIILLHFTGMGYKIANATLFIPCLMCIFVSYRLTALAALPLLIILVLSAITGCLSMLWLFDPRLSYNIFVFGMLSILPAAVVSLGCRAIVKARGVRGT